MQCPCPDAQRLHSRTISQAQKLGDTTYTRRARTLGRLLAGAHAAAESHLNPGLSNIAAVSKVNTTFRNAWAKTPPVSSSRVQLTPPGVPSRIRMLRSCAALQDLGGFATGRDTPLPHFGSN